MEGETLETGTKFRTRYGGVIFVEKEGYTHTVTDPDTGQEEKRVFETREAQLEDIHTYKWLTKVEVRELDIFIRRIEIRDMECPKCGQTHDRLFALSGHITRGGKRVQRYKCSLCGYEGSKDKFKSDTPVENG